MIYVTGGAGFIGSNLVKKISKLQLDNVVVVDQQSKLIQEKPNLDRYVSGFIDYHDFIQNLNILEKDDVIFHQGACTDTMNYDSMEMIYKNFEYSKILFDYCSRNDVRLIYASSAAVYGLGHGGFYESVVCENPINIYAQSKLLFDNYVRCFEVGSQVVGLRYFNVYGPGEQAKGRMASTIYQFFNQIKDTQSVEPFKGSDQFVRDFIYIDDIINVNLFFYHNPSLSGLFNCGSGQPESFMVIVHELKKYYKFDIIEKEMPEGLKEKYQKYTKADLTKLKEVGYRFPFMTLKQGIEKYIQTLEE
jgi:ADP-L-glycero-D-manno-heptose 6-epimerase